MKSKIKHFLIICAFFVFSYSVFAENLTNTAYTQQGTKILPPIRRLGLEIPETNVSDFRKYIKRNERSLYGIPSLPLDAKGISDLVSEAVKNSIQNSGRFWPLALNEFISVNNLKEMTSAEVIKTKLENDYNLDAWLFVKVYFSPDQTLIRLSIKAPNKSTMILAREDILVEPQVDESKLKKGINNALTKLINTIGHDGKVTYARENLVTVDYGTERGVLPGSILHAGYVLLKSYHPSSGEFLKSERISVHKLKVLEAREGSSLCKIIETNRLVYEQALSVVSTRTVLLSWREDSVLSKQDGWREPYNPDTSPLLGVTEEGFSREEFVKKHNAPPAKAAEILRGLTPPPSKKIRDTEQNKPPKEVSIQELEDEEVNEEESEEVKKMNFSSSLNEPSSWSIKNIYVGAGMSIGQKRQGEASSIPSTILNRLNARSVVNVDSELMLRLRPSAQYSFYDRRSFKGKSYYVGSILEKMIWRDQETGNRIFLGGGVDLRGGAIKTPQNKEKLSGFTVYPSIAFEAVVKGMVKYDIQAEFSALDIIKNDFVWSIMGHLNFLQLLPEDLSFDVTIKQYTKNFQDVGFGASWNILPFIEKYF